MKRPDRNLTRATVPVVTAALVIDKIGFEMHPSREVCAVSAVTGYIHTAAAEQYVHLHHATQESG